MLRSFEGCDMLEFPILILMAAPILAVLFALSIITPTWHWVIGFIALIASALTYIWIEHWVVSSRPGYKEGPGGGLGILLVGAWTWSPDLVALARIERVAQVLTQALPYL